MSREDLLQMQGTIVEAMGSGHYVVQTNQAQGVKVKAQLSGRMRKFRIRVVEGDEVTVAVSPYDLSRGLIVYRGAVDPRLAKAK